MAEGALLKIDDRTQRKKGGLTELHLTQTGVPEEHADAIDDGWHEHYWRPLKRMLEK